MALIGETASERDVGQLQLLFPQQVLGAIDASVHNEIVRGLACRLAEHAGEMPHAPPGQTGEIRERDFLLQMGVDVVADTPPIPRGEGAGRRMRGPGFRKDENLADQRSTMLSTNMRPIGPSGSPSVQSC